MLSNFEGIEHFSPDSKVDHWGDPSKINPEVLRKVDLLRSRIDKPIFVTRGYDLTEKFGVTHSQHALGNALDIVCPEIGLMEFYHAAEALGFNGLGVYPAWQANGRVVGGLHVDVRYASHARWMGVPDGNGGQVYIALNQANLEEWGLG